MRCWPVEDAAVALLGDEVNADMRDANMSDTTVPGMWAAAAVQIAPVTACALWQALGVKFEREKVGKSQRRQCKDIVLLNAHIAP